MNKPLPTARSIAVECVKSVHRAHVARLTLLVNSLRSTATQPVLADLEALVNDMRADTQLFLDELES